MVDESMLSTLANAGGITPETLVWCDGMSQSTPAQKALSALFSGGATSPPPPAASMFFSSSPASPPPSASLLPPVAPSRRSISSSFPERSRCVAYRWASGATAVMDQDIRDFSPHRFHPIFIGPHWNLFCDCRDFPFVGGEPAEERSNYRGCGGSTGGQPVAFLIFLPSRLDSARFLRACCSWDSPWSDAIGDLGAVLINATPRDASEQ